MNEKYLNNLYNTCQELININKINNKNNIFKEITSIINIFNEILLNCDENTVYNAVAIIIDIKETKPELKGVVDAILEIIKETFQKEKKVRR